MCLTKPVITIPRVLILPLLLISLKQAVSCWSAVPVVTGWLQFAADPMIKEDMKVLSVHYIHCISSSKITKFLKKKKYINTSF